MESQHNPRDVFEHLVPGVRDGDLERISASSSPAASHIRVSRPWTRFTRRCCATPASSRACCRSMDCPTRRLGG